MTRLLLIRHGETTWNNEIRIQGQTDIPLSDVGREQARLLGRRLARTPIVAAYASDLDRAAATAGLILDGRDISLVVCSDLREADFGAWEGLTYAEVTERYPEEQAARRARPAEVAPPGGELLPDMLRRVQRTVQRIISKHPDQNVLVVSHGGPLRVLLGGLLGLGLESYWKIRVDNCALSIVDTYPEGAILSLLNDTSHLPASPNSPGVP